MHSALRMFYTGLCVTVNTRKSLGRLPVGSRTYSWSLHGRENHAALTLNEVYVNVFTKVSTNREKQRVESHAWAPPRGEDARVTGRLLFEG